MTTLTPTDPLTLHIVPVMVDEAKAWMGVTHDDDNELIASLIFASAETVEALTQTSLAPRSYVLTDTAAYATTTYVAALTRGPIASVSSVSIIDADGVPTPVDASDYVVDGSPALRFPRGVVLEAGSTLRVAFTTAPLDPLPAALRVAVLRGVAHAYENRGTTTTAGMQALPASAYDVLQAHRVYTV